MTNARDTTKYNTQSHECVYEPGSRNGIRFELYLAIDAVDRASSKIQMNHFIRNATGVENGENRF